MRVEINYGKGKLPVELPEGLDVTVIARREMATLADAPRAIEAALSELPNGTTLCSRTICELLG